MLKEEKKTLKNPRGKGVVRPVPVARPEEPKFTVPAENGGKALSPSEIIALAKTKFYKDPNVIGVGLGCRRKKGISYPDQRALIIYVKEKLSKEECKKEYLIPKTFEGLKTDVVTPFCDDAPKEALGFAESHQHSDDMMSVDLGRLHEQWSLEAGGPIPFQGKVQRFGDVVVIEDDGTLIKTVNNNQVVDYVRAYKLFRTIQPDIYDFMTFFTDSDNGMPPQGGSSWYQPIFNDSRGIGLTNFNGRSAYDSDVLQGIMFLNQGHFPIWRYVMLQEQGHRWSSFARYRDTQNGVDKSDHMLNGWAHWALNFDEDHSAMSYDPYDWQANGNNFNRVSLTSEERGYCNLDLYLMGLLSAWEVGNFYLLSNVQQISGNLYSANQKALSTQNIIWSEGSRVPSVRLSQKLFKNGFVVITGDMDKVHDLVAEVDALRLRFQDDFHQATKKLAQVDTTIGPLIQSTRTDFRTVTVNIPRGTGRRSIETHTNFGSTVLRASVALNGFKLDFANKDHHINIVEADTDRVRIDGNKVYFKVECNYADKNFDDPYSGYVTAVVIAEIAQ